MGQRRDSQRCDMMPYAVLGGHGAVFYSTMPINGSHEEVGERKCGTVELLEIHCLRRPRIGLG